MNAAFMSGVRITLNREQGETLRNFVKDKTVLKREEAMEMLWKRKADEQDKLYA